MADLLPTRAYGGCRGARGLRLPWDPVYTVAVADLHDERAVNAASWTLHRPAAVMLVCPREAADDIRGWAESVSENVR